MKDIGVINEFDQAIESARGWIDEGKFTFNGLVYKIGVNSHSACKLLSELCTLRITDLAFHFDDLMCVRMGQPGTQAAGFTIGKGRTLYWYITPMEKSCLYRCLKVDNNGYLGNARFVDPSMLVTVRFYPHPFVNKQPL